MKTFIIGLFTLFLTSCANVNPNFFQINSGDSKQSIMEKLGSPDDRQFKGRHEAFQYCTTGTSFGKSTFNVVWLFDGIVTGANTYTVAHAASCMGHFRQIDWEDAPDITVEIRNK